MKNKGFKVIEAKVGNVTSYNELRKHAEIILSGTLCVGDKIKVKGKGYEWEYKVESMFIKHKPVAKAWAGQTVWIRVEKPVKPGDEVLLLKTVIESQPVSPQPSGPKHFTSEGEDKREVEERDRRKKKRRKNKSGSSDGGGKNSERKPSPGEDFSPDSDIGDLIDFIKDVADAVSESDGRENSGKGEDQKADRSGNKKETGGKGESSAGGSGGNGRSEGGASDSYGGAGGNDSSGGGKGGGQRKDSGGKSRSGKGKSKGSGGKG